MSAASHRIKILQALKAGRRLTPMDALNEFGCYRLAARVYQLREDGWNIDTDISEGFATYRLVSKIRRKKAA